MSIYKKMEEDWETYCLMSGIAFIEEMNKPSVRKVIKGKKEYMCYNSIQFRVNNKNIIDRWLKITRIWEEKLGEKFITSYFNKPRLDKEGRKWYIIFLPNWLYNITKTVGAFPSNYSNQKIFDRLINWKISGNKKKRNILTKKQIKSLLNPKDYLYNKLLTNKYLATGAFIITFDLEIRGISTGHLDLCMSENYKDFLEFMLTIANKFSWSTKSTLSPVSVEFSKKRGIKANPQFNFRLKTNKVEEIYNLAGPVIDKHKNKFLKFHINRSKNFKKGDESQETKYNILNYLREQEESLTRDIQYFSGIGIDVTLYHLHNLKKQGLIHNERIGKGYIWRIKNANQCRYSLSEGRRRI